MTDDIKKEPTQDATLVARRERYSNLAVGTSRPDTLFSAMEIAAVLADSNFVPEAYRGKRGDVLAAILYGAELGLGPMQALRGIALVNGRPSVWGDVLLGLITARPDCDGVIEQDLPVIEKSGSATCTVKRRGRPDVTRSFDNALAGKAGLIKKQGSWQTHPSRMLQMRARGFALRDAYADVLSGLITAEEARDLPPVVSYAPGPADSMALPVSGAKALEAVLGLAESAPVTAHVQDDSDEYVTNDAEGE